MLSSRYTGALARGPFHGGRMLSGGDMNMRTLRVWVGLVLGGSGALMFAASWERRTRWCLSGSDEPLQGCDGREDNLYHLLNASALLLLAR